MSPAPIDDSSVWRLIESRAVATPDACFAIDDQDRSLDFAGYRNAALRTAAGLADQNIRAGTVVSWQLPTSIESLVLAGALARLGAVQNPILPIYRQREVGFVAHQTGAALLAVPSVLRGFDHGAMARAIAAEAEGLETLIVDDALPEGDPANLPAFADASESPVRWLFYTSGTTADPKGARHTDTTLMAVGRALEQRLALQSDDRIALVFPFTHVGGMSWLLAGLLSGCAQIVIPAFGPEAIDALARHGVTQGTAGTAFHQAYLEAQRTRGPEPIFPKVRSFPGGGAPKPPQLHADLKGELGGAGIVSGYGLTECPIATMGSVDDPDVRLAHTEGRPAAGVEVRIVGPNGPVAPEEEGEIRLTGPQLFRGYLDATLDAAAFDSDGLFRSGDLGHLTEDGYLVVTGRLKDVIIRKGENISAKEVEDLLHQHPRVAEAAVIGLPDPASGERACAVVACREDAAPLGFEEMSEFLRKAGLMVQKVPEQLEILPALPRNPTGKVLKHELRKRFGTAD